MKQELARVNRILEHPLFRKKLREIEELERQRMFCRHGLEHLLAVARLAHIAALEGNLDMAKERVYAAALLHDIGRGEQYLNDTPHDEAGVAVAEGILADCGFDQAESAEILSCIASHRNDQTAQKEDLSGLIYRADKKSRNCFWCPVMEQCKWAPEKRNTGIQS